MKAAGIRGTVKNFTPVSVGFNKHNVETKLFDTVGEALEWGADFFIQTNIWSPFNQEKNKYLMLSLSGKPRLVVESPPLRFIQDNKKWYRLSWNSFLFPDAIYPWHNSKSARWESLSKLYNLKIKDWNRLGIYITIGLQKFSDSSLNSLYPADADKPFPYYLKWLKETINEIQKLTDRPIVIRPHPLNNETQIERIKKEFPEHLVSRDNKYWEKSHCVVTYNSLFALDCLYNGIPVISLHDSSLHRFFSKDHIESLNTRPVNLNRELIFEKLSYCQWREDELREGIPIPKLLECMPK